MNWNNLETGWRLLNRRQANVYWSHYVYMNDAGTIALADHSIRDLNDPNSTDDGLLTWTHEKLWVSNRRGNAIVSVPVYMKDRRTSTVITCFATAVVIAQACVIPMHELIPELDICKESEVKASNPAPEEYEDPNDYVRMGWVDSRGRP